jgi:hypothetical protein
MCFDEESLIGGLRNSTDLLASSREDQVSDFFCMAVALMSDTATPRSCGNFARWDGRCPIPCVAFQSLRAILIGSMPACFHQARSSRERCTAR